MERLVGRAEAAAGKCAARTPEKRRARLQWWQLQFSIPRAPL